MKRRGVLVAASLALAGCVGRAADTSGPRIPPTAPADDGGASTPRPDLYLTTFDAEVGANGDLRVVGTVANRAGVRRTGTVDATVTVDGETYADSTGVTVDAGGEARFEIPFDVAYDAFEGSGDLSVRVTG